MHCRELVGWGEGATAPLAQNLSLLGGRCRGVQPAGFEGFWRPQDPQTFCDDIGALCPLDTRMFRSIGYGHR